MDERERNPSGKNLERERCLSQHKPFKGLVLQQRAKDLHIVTTKQNF
jgi:hypothetical protein